MSKYSKAVKRLEEKNKIETDPHERYMNECAMDLLEIAEDRMKRVHKRK